MLSGIQGRSSPVPAPPDAVSYASHETRALRAASVSQQLSEADEKEGGG